MEQENWPYSTPGIPDEMFIRGKIPMTKKEVRVISLAQARLCKDSIVFDIGAGTGSFSVEAALVASEGQVYAVEREAEGVELIRKNATKFTVGNIKIISGSAPVALEGLPRPDRVFIGGSGGNLTGILEALDKVLKPGGRLVANAIVVENLVTVSRFLRDTGYEDIETTLVSIAKTHMMGENNMLKGSNPVYIVSAQKPSFFEEA